MIELKGTKESILSEIKALHVDKNDVLVVTIRHIDELKR